MHLHELIGMEVYDAYACQIADTAEKILLVNGFGRLLPCEAQQFLGQTLRGLYPILDEVNQVTKYWILREAIDQVSRHNIKSATILLKVLDGLG